MVIGAGSQRTTECTQRTQRIDNVQNKCCSEFVVSFVSLLRVLCVPSNLNHWSGLKLRFKILNLYVSPARCGKKSICKLIDGNTNKGDVSSGFYVPIIAKGVRKLEVTICDLKWVQAKGRKMMQIAPWRSITRCWKYFHNSSNSFRKRTS